MSEAEDFGEAVELASAGASRESVSPVQTDKHVCPYCGLVGPRPDGPCSRCTIEDSPQTRQATKARIGPWYVLQSRNPAAPGMKWSTLLALVKKGQVTPRAVVRGPTTHQLWRLASQVKGLSREFSVCYSCGGQIDRTANQCPHCDRLQEPPPNPDQLLESREPLRKLETPETPPAELGLARRDPPRPDAGLLTAKELAAAFQLDFSPEGGATLAPPVTPANRTVPKPQKVAEPQPVETPANTETSPVVKPRRSFGRAVLVLVLLGLVGVFAVIWLNPPYQAMAKEWLTASWNTLQNQFNSTSAPKTAAQPNSNVEKSSVSLSDPVRTSPASDTKPSGTESQPKQNVQPNTQASVPNDPEAIRALVRTLRSSAIDAEAAGDYRKAVAQYEQIRRTPHEYWPSDLELRLDAAKLRSRQ